VLILKGVKVISFDTLLQVLILKGLAEPRGGVRRKTGALRIPACFLSKSAQTIENKGREAGKELQER
jgi:hypothetical protein